VTRHMRRPGLQVWLVATLIAVGALASLSVLISIVPTFQSSLRDAHATATARQLRSDLDQQLTELPAQLPASSSGLNALATSIGSNVGAQVRIISSGLTTHVGISVGCCALLDHLHLEYGSRLPGDAALVADDNRAVYARFAQVHTDLDPRILGTAGSFVIEAATPVRGISGDELATIQLRLMLAVAAVLGLAALAGYGLSVFVGRRIAVLASTASLLAGGDLAARAPQQGIREFAVLGDSLNSMASQIEGQVDEITRERDRARVLISSLVEGVIAVAESNQVMMINPAARRILGLERSPDIRTVGDLPTPIHDAIRAADRAGRGEIHEGEVTLDDGTEVELAIAGLSAPSAGVVVTVRDVTEQRRLDRARRDLVANVSHELKTPLAAIKGLLELLEGGRVDAPRQEEFLGLMSREAERLERLVEEQLQLARLDSGALPLDRERFDLDALVTGVVASRIPLAEAQGITMTARSDAFATVDADPARIEQVLLILLDNALRHTASGGTITVGARRTHAEGQILVTDTGEGIAYEDQPFIFDRFYRGDQSREGRSAGLGLAIARGIAKAHGGVIDVVSVPHEGSTFTLRLPLAVQPHLRDLDDH